MDDVIGNRYEMQDAIGRGGMATIFRAVDLRMGRIVAVKVLREVYSSDPKFVTRFQREARAASALQHPNIVQVFDYGQSERELLHRHGVRGWHGPPALPQAPRRARARIAPSRSRMTWRSGSEPRTAGASSIATSSRRTSCSTTTGLVKLTDFGIASMYKDVEAERLTTTGMTLGTVQYYAPEQAQGEIVCAVGGCLRAGHRALRDADRAHALRR